MPKLVRLYIVNVLIGFGLSALFLLGLLWLDIGALRGLILGSPVGWIAALMMLVMNGVVFAGVQFAIAIQRMAEDDSGPKGGSRAPSVTARPAAVKVAAK